MERTKVSLEEILSGQLPTLADLDRKLDEVEKSHGHDRRTMRIVYRQAMREAHRLGMATVVRGR